MKYHNGDIIKTKVLVPFHKHYKEFSNDYIQCFRCDIPKSNKYMCIVKDSFFNGIYVRCVMCNSHRAQPKEYTVPTAFIEKKIGHLDEPYDMKVARKIIKEYEALDES